MIEDLCEGRPESCFECPYPDCIFGGKNNDRELTFLTTARKKAEKRKRENDKIYKVCFDTRIDGSCLGGDGMGSDLFISISR